MPSKKLILAAMKSANKSEHMSGYHHGAVLYSGGKVLRVGNNHSEFHAEQDVLRIPAETPWRKQG